MHTPPANIGDFDRGASPQSLHDNWHKWVSEQMATSPDFLAWYDPQSPPNAQPPSTKAPPWQGLPRTALLLQGNDVLGDAQTVDEPVEFGSGPDGLLISQPPFLDTQGNVVPGLKYRPQDEYLEWVPKRDPDGVIREIWFTCEGPEYWQFLANQDRDLTVTLYAELLGVNKTDIDPNKLYFEKTLTHVEPFAQNSKLTFPAQSYNFYNEYNLAGAIHLTQGANTLGAEISLAMAGSLIWGNPPKTSDPTLICCAGYGEPNRFSDPTIGKEVNDLARGGSYVTLRDPVGLYMTGIRSDDFTDWNGHAVPDLGSQYFVPIRKSADGSLVLRSKFKVPDGVMRDGKQARVGDLKCLGHQIVTGGQVANAITMNLFAQAIPGAPPQQPRQCSGKPCPSAAHPGFIIPTDINKPCSPPMHALAAHLKAVAPLSQLPKTANIRSRRAFHP